MERRGPTLLNIPPPPSDPVTPSDMGPGTPNSATTSMSNISVIAIKDGALGHGRGGAHHSASTLEAERNDRISRLAGLERVGGSSHLAPGYGRHPLGYFDTTPLVKERSTVGSASATGSIAGGRTSTWASGSVDYDADKMSESQDQDDGVSSAGGMSDEDKASLVAFGEGAGSTVSGPISTRDSRAAARGFGNPTTPRTGAPGSASGLSTPMSGIIPTGQAGSTDPKMMDGMSYDSNVVDTTMQPAPPVDRSQQGNRYSGQGVAAAEAILRDQLGDSESGRRGMGTPDGQHLGKFAFEKD